MIKSDGGAVGAMLSWKHGARLSKAFSSAGRMVNLGMVALSAAF
jgi:hypothetical protein